MRCLLTGKEFDPKDQTDGEHIIPASLGGNLKSRTVICPEANNLTSRLDTALYEIFKLSNAQFRITSERDRGTLRKYYFSASDGISYVYNPENNTIDLAHEIINKPETVESGTKMSFQFPASFGAEKSKQKAEMIIRKWGLRQLGQEMEINEHTYELKRFTAPSISAAIEFNQDAVRAVIKNAFLFAASSLGEEQFLASNYDQIRSIILGDEDGDVLLCQFPRGSLALISGCSPPNHILSVFEANNRLWVYIAYYAGYVFLVDLGDAAPALLGSEYSVMINPHEFTTQKVDLDSRNWFLKHINATTMESIFGDPDETKRTIERMLSVWASDYRDDNWISHLVNNAMADIFGDWENTSEPILNVSEKMDLLQQELIKRLIDGKHIIIENFKNQPQTE